MPTLGITTKPTSYWWSTSNGIEQIGEKLTAPEALRILSVAQWVGGYSGSCRGRLCVWDATTFVLLGYSAEVTVPNGGGAGGSLTLMTAALLAPVQLARNAQFIVGFQRIQADGFTYFGTNTDLKHWIANSGNQLPANLGAGPGSPAPSEVKRRIGSYVANYEPTPGAWVYRSGTWQRAEKVSVYRSGAWAEVTGVQAHRSGSWRDAE